MKKHIILTESELKRLISECVLEYCNHNSSEEGKSTNILAALGLAASGMAGLGYTNTPDTTHQQTIMAPQTNFTTDMDNGSTISYYDYLKNKLTNRNQTKPQQQANTATTKQKPEQTKKPYTPSSHLIDFIKSYETFHDGWIDDGDGNPTTGWGFKITPELKKKFPNGMHRDKNGNTPEADAYLIKYINSSMDEFRKSTPNLDKLPQEYGDALFDVFYNVGGKIYRNSPKLQNALKNMDLQQIANNLRYGKLKGHKLRSADRKNILKGNYKRTQ